MSLHRPSGQKMSVFFTWLFLSRNFREILRLFSGTGISCISAGSNDIFTKIDIFKKKSVRQINVHSTTRASDLFYVPGKLRQIHPRGCHYDQIFRKFDLANGIPPSENIAGNIQAIFSVQFTSYKSPRSFNFSSNLASKPRIASKHIFLAISSQRTSVESIRFS